MFFFLYLFIYIEKFGVYDSSARLCKNVVACVCVCVFAYICNITRIGRWMSAKVSLYFSCEFYEIIVK